MIKRRLSRLLLTWDVLTLVFVFVVVILFFENVVEPILVEQRYEQIRSQIDRTRREYARSNALVARQPALQDEESEAVIAAAVARFALSEAQFARSIAYVFAPSRGEPASCYGGVRSDGGVQAADCEELSLSTPLGELVSSDFDSPQAPITFALNAEPYVGSIAALSLGADVGEASSTLLLVADTRRDFYRTANSLRAALLIVVGGVLAAILVVKLLNTFAATRELRSIQAAIDEKSRIVRETGAIDAPVPMLPLAFRETEELYSSFEEMNGKLADLGSIVSGISDSELFIATLKQDHSLLAPHQEEMAILFLDVRGFTSVAEERDEAAMEIINAIWATVENAVYSASGKINKYMGDACLSIFPNTHNGHNPAARHALTAAVRIESKRHELNTELETDLGYRIGIDCGTVVYGRTGSQRNFELGVIGDTVNTASRLEELNKTYGTSILITGSALAAAGLALDAPGLFEVETESGVQRFRPLLVDVARPRGKSVAEHLVTLVMVDDSGSRLFGSPDPVREDVFVAFDRLQRHYQRGVRLWESDPTGAQALWQKLAHGFARLAFRLDFRPARPFVERLVSRDQYTRLEESRGKIVRQQEIEIAVPHADWIQHRTPELQK
ncbi:MAG: adenylate/guanylate cyclase domain-containing protein [Spirochaetales bacterium]